MSETSVGKGFGVTVGILMAIFTVLVVFPMLFCGGCTVFTAMLGGAGRAVEKTRAYDAGTDPTVTSPTNEAPASQDDGGEPPKDI